MDVNYFREQLAEQGYQLALEARAGKWDGAPGAVDPTGPSALLRELRRRCPGFTDADYSRALADGLFNAR